MTRNGSTINMETKKEWTKWQNNSCIQYTWNLHYNYQLLNCKNNDENKNNNCENKSNKMNKMT